jgi:predicted O-methyltransferase YrrM
MSKVRDFSSSVRLVSEAYSKNGYRLLGGYSHFVFPDTGIIGSYVEKNGVVQSTSGGLPFEEWPVLYGIFEQLKPSGILIVGNSYGVSTLFSLAVNPKSLVIAIDKFRTRGLQVTTEIGKEIDGNLICIQGSTPDDLVEVATRFPLESKSLDFVFFDAVHEPEILALEYLALRDSLSAGGVMVFHDCFTSGLVSAFRALEDHGHEDSFYLLSRSVSGLGCIVKDGLKTPNYELLAFLDFYSDGPKTVHELSDLFSRSGSESAADFFAGVSTELKFPPHPQI